jgi:hypothetical protein
MSRDGNPGPRSWTDWSTERSAGKFRCSSAQTAPSEKEPMSETTGRSSPQRGEAQVRLQQTGPRTVEWLAPSRCLSGCVIVCMADGTLTLYLAVRHGPGRSAGRSNELADRTAAEMVWPLLALRIRTMRLELRLPTCADIVRLAPASYHSAYGVRNGAAFTATELLAREQARSIAEWSVEDWSLTFGAFLNSGEPVGLQTIAAARFPATRTFETPSWVNPGHSRDSHLRVRCSLIEMKSASYLR